MSVTFPAGFRAAAATAGLKPSGKSDLLLLVRDPSPSSAFAAVFTTNQIVGAPVAIGRDQRFRHLRGQLRAPRALLVNAGNSNAATGEKGIADAKRCMEAVAALVKCAADEVVVSSTGVIGRPLPVEKITGALGGLTAGLARGEEADAAAAAAIMTTDLVPKAARREVVAPGGVVRIGAVAKGSGMIAPRLDSPAHAPTPSATMLAFITTDASIGSRDLQVLLEEACAGSFNRISVDNHPSCSDSVVCLASGKSGVRVEKGTKEWSAFAEAFTDVCRELSEKVVTDGEGATRVFKVTVRGAASSGDAEKMAREVVNSPLVKCAVHGRDPNWGRIVTAAGNAGVRFDPAQAGLTIGPVEVYRGGMPVVEALGDPRLKEAMAAARVECVLTVGAGKGESWMLGCDLSKEYVAINAEYTT
ncbi:MAG TPA: bifunctional glutamate N-acetyltransferase/amino-acid acetyltransferase ArgJ [Phycisphaerales bacterium]|nr:bifunctional glutamate N-acetyltransferase/amino-acid acetyltransferase ArgJ [Phycisphaerales bacterium]